MVERIRMAGEQQQEEGPSQSPQGGVAVAEKLSDQPKVVIADEGTQSKGPGFWGKIVGGETKPLVLVQQPHARAILKPKEEPQNTQAPSTPQNQTQVGNAQGIMNEGEQYRMDLDGGIPPPDGGGGNQGGDGGGGPEGSRGPEWEASPERGEWLMERIAFMETMLPYEVRYNAENGPVLNGLYDELIEYVDGLEENRYYRSSFNLREAHPKVAPEPDEPLIDAIKKSYKERAAKIIQQANVDTQAPEDFTGVESLDTLAQKYDSLSTPVTERPQIEEQLLKYFKEAKRKGLLAAVDGKLNTIYLRYTAGQISADQARDFLYQSIIPSVRNNRPDAIVSAELAYRLKMGDPEVNPTLFNVWQPYLQWAGARFISLLDEEPQADYREGEWRPLAEQTQPAVKETYWEPYAGYPDYYTVKARTPAEFMTAKEDFLQMLRTHALGYDPNELIQNLINFKKVMSRNATELAGQQADWPEGPDKMTLEFAEELRQEFEGEGFLWHIAYNIENYNKDGAKQGEMALALHEGPQRYTRALRSRRGETGAYEFSLDNDPLVELAYNAQGSRGQIGHRSDIQNHFRGWIQQKVIERGMGVVLKDYDNRDVVTYSDPEFRYLRAGLLDAIESQLRRNSNNLQILSEEDRKLYIESRKLLRENQERIGLHQSEEAFRSLYEGMDRDENGFIRGDAHLRNYQMFRNYQPALIPVSEDQLPLEVRKSIDDSNDSDEIKQQKKDLLLIHLAEDQLPAGLRESVALGRVQQAIIDLRGQVRTGAVALKRNEVLIDKLVALNRISDEDRKLYKEAYEKSKASFDLAMQMQIAMREQAIRGGGIYFMYKNPYILEYLKIRGSKDHELSLAERKKWTREQHIGWILNEIAKGKRVDTLTPEELQIYQGLSDKEKENNADHIPTHLAIKAVQAAVNWIKMRYRDDSDIWDRPDLKQWIHVKDDKGNYKYLNFKAVFRDAMVEQTRDMAVEQIATNGFEAKFYYTDFKATGFDVKKKEVTLEAMGGAQPMMLSQPKGEIDPQTGRMIVEDVEPVHLDFDKAVNSYLALHTTHTYWAYQNNNTHTLVPEYVFEQARQIKDGRLRFEDADSLAGLLLTLDPTLCNVRSFPGDQMGLEYIVFDAAVEESLLSWVDIKKALSQRFLPADGNPEYMQAGYHTEDLGGDSRFTLMIQNLVAKMPKRFSRRFAAALSITPMYASTMADNLGRKGVMGAVSMMDDHIHNISGQRELGQFGITKFINLMDAGSKLYFTLVGGTDPQTGDYHEGLFIKPLNNSDKLVKLREKIGKALVDPEEENDVFYALIDTFGRQWDTLKKIRTMYSDNRNAQGALDLRKTDVFLPDGRYNPAINTDRNTGSSRHIAKMYWDAYVEWLLDPGPGGGAEAYPSEAAFYIFLKQPYKYFAGRDEKGHPKILPDPNGRTWSDWLFDKMAL